MSIASKLFDPLQVGDLTLAHRIVMAPMTRLRATPDVVVTGFTAVLFSAFGRPGTLLITEAVVDVIHVNGSYIYPQIVALGRMGYPEVLHAGGHPYVSSSSTKLDSRSESPTELGQIEIKRAVHEAGFDGIEIHACNGSFIEQFIQDVVNKRTDDYGDSIENRSRFALEVTEAAVSKIGAKRTGIRFSPWSKGREIAMRSPVPTYTYIVSELVKRHSELTYIHMIEPGINSADNGTTQELDEGVIASNDFAFQIWSPLPTSPVGATDRLKNAAIVIERLFISNPDLPLRIKAGIKPAAFDPSTYYTLGPESVKGYTDYSSLDLQAQA
ncbi:hypothetical protein B0J17DRAFT_693727 [Rhizoctonia solani]|nr:hypothetical protein B0J17DRAFT_693727 [Rhizoctonia solani]